ncbi:hypothetical protein ACFP2T_17755 [Plantactinospora solaniradicis]|uniref:Uncharacterized protein n=1 Tax=Plantactinospora solaniradicis TaxID=1723736 RepID=A0ABW1KA66_9ACTN
MSAPDAELAASIERQQRMREELAGMEPHPGSVDGHRVDLVEVEPDRGGPSLRTALRIRSSAFNRRIPRRDASI